MTASRFTPEDDVTLLTLRQQGSTYASIARAIRCCTSTVHNRIVQLVAARITLARALELAEEWRQKRAAEAAAKPPPLPPLQAPNAIPAPNQPGKRRCLGGCGQFFKSSSAANRICLRCQPRRAGVTRFSDPI